ncbi:DUF883 family protein [Sulfitobacter geojensis]|uniref:DUF883 family protein n=1 Tax=Sulfitobacter geojensis TaxID=1342299 RepID=A0AAE3B6I9_9RHOB|nr:DUF883 family protein [Sulfitobacter geojensis]KHA53154.1 DUF883 domain containing protein [Sulfitobacter geojensis]MBM1689912.1 DUF883 family protein [Sulfitobacter geojensis]MBM1693978.1 DUF883 family protein [Sulfitobacter geojensis]MBM1706144.1 DUF883 family protein [Sulfitobacter geojensis]MBM1710202.1 DUF883 family protein [Sulfitobacter geojensis]
MAQTTKNNVAELNTDVSKQMAVLREDIANLSATVAEYGKAQGAIMKSAATQKADQAVETGAAAAEALKVKANKTYTDAEDAVRANPGTAIGIAAGVGFLVGMMSARR